MHRPKDPLAIQCYKQQIRSSGMTGQNIKKAALCGSFFYILSDLKNILPPYKLPYCRARRSSTQS